MRVLNRIASMAVAAGVFTGVAMSSATAEELSLAHFTSPTHHLQVNIWEPLAKDLAEATDGELTLQIYPAGALGTGPSEQYNRVIDGIADIVHGLPGYTSVLFPKTLLIELPGVPRSDEQATSGLWNAMPLIEDEFRRVKPLAVFTSAAAMLMTTDTPIRKPEDLEGLKIRVPSANVGKAVAAWGGTAVSMPITEVYNAAQTGVIDGALLDGSTLQSFKLHEVFDYYTVGVPPTTSALFLLMNRNSWESLSEEHKAVINKLTGFELSQKSSKSYRDQHEAGLDLVRSQSGKTIIELTEEQAAAFFELSRPIIENTVEALKARGVANAAEIVEAMGGTYQPEAE